MEDGWNNSGELNRLLSEAGLQPLDLGTEGRFRRYLALILRWNARTNLTAVRDPQAIIARHFVESIACAQHLPAGIASLLDFGSGAGFPGVPIALCRPEIAVTLAETQTKKVAFLSEALRVLDVNATIWPKRAEEISRDFGCVALRAVDKMERATSDASGLVRARGWLAVLTTESQLSRIHGSVRGEFLWSPSIPLYGAFQQILSLGMNVDRERDST